MNDKTSTDGHDELHSQIQYRLIEELSAAERRYRELVERIHEIIFRCDEAGALSFLNPAWGDILGYSHEESLDTNLGDYMHHQDRARSLAFIARKPVDIVDEENLEIRFVHKKGHSIWLSLSISAGDNNHRIGSLFNIDELIRAEKALQEANEKLEERVAKRTAELEYSNRLLADEIDKREQAQKELVESYRKLQETHTQLLQSEKMASIGQLAAGVAHEINNPIGYVNSNLGSMRKYVKDLFQLLDAYEGACNSMEQCPEARDSNNTLIDLKQKLDMAYMKEDLVDLVNESQEGLDRVKKIVQDLKDFSHVDESEWQQVDLHKGLDSTLNIVNSAIKYKVDVIKEYGDLPLIECMPSQINQVFLNLLLNAAHAIEGRGTVTIRTGSQEDQGWIEISDTGKGIEPAMMKRIFEPFFTTKTVGEGTGLGLSVSFGIIEKHGGCIEVESEVGNGALFRIRLPINKSSQHDTLQSA